MNIAKKLLPAFMFVTMVIYSHQYAAATEFSTLPTTNQGKKWRIGYYEGGIYPNYYKYLSGTIQGLMDLGWIKKVPLPNFDDENSQLLWSWLSKTAKSDYLYFRDDAFYTSNWDKANREKISKSIIKRLAKESDIDLMIAMGTWAGKDLANDKHHTNTIVMSTSDPVRSEIITSVSDSGRDHIHARVDPYRYERQVRIFHELVKFKKLGVAFENSVAGRSYAAIDMIEKVANEAGFEIERCYTTSDISNQSLAGESVIECFSEFSKRDVDAIYITVQGGVNDETLPTLISIANKNRIPTFSQFGSEEVKKGFLMSISRAGGFKPAGRYFAAILAQVFNGAKPRQLDQVFEEAQNIAINLKTAEIIGFYLYADILAAADEIYTMIESH
jgi:ABC-type uncharacterized transport system substrate-binding protein